LSNGRSPSEPIQILGEEQRQLGRFRLLADLYSNDKTRLSAEKPGEFLGWSPRVDLKEGQRLTVQYLER